MGVVRSVCTTHKVIVAARDQRGRVRFGRRAALVERDDHRARPHPSGRGGADASNAPTRGRRAKCACSDDLPVYLFWLRNDAGGLAALVAILCRSNGNTENDARSFSLVQALLRPALECLRRDLLARAAITDLNRTVHALDKDLELLLNDPGTRSTAGDGADELKGILQQAIEHLHCVMAALIVPDKGIVLMRTDGQKAPDNQLVARTHRQLLSMAQMRREPIIINRLAGSGIQGSVPYRILSCPLQHATGRTMGVLALFRDEESPEFVDRDARLVDILARKSASVIESNYDAISGLYTRPAFEQRVRAVVNNPQRTALVDRSLHRFRPAARHQRQLRHARRGQRDRPARRARAPQAPSRSICRPHLRRPLRRAAADRSRRWRAIRRVAARRRGAARHVRRASPGSTCRSASAWPRSIPRPAS